MITNSIKKQLWVFDFDGTLSEIVPDRHEAVLDPLCRVMLERLIKRHESHVAILSSREIHDLAGRADIPGIYLGAACGLEWILPGGEKKSFVLDFDQQLITARAFLLAEIKKLQIIQDLDVEDKRYSVTFHLRSCAPDKKEWVPAFIKSWESSYGVKVLEGPESMEVHFLPEINKAFGIQKFYEITGCTQDDAQIVYAGDDENDAIAMQWVLMHGGITFTVGDSPLVPASKVILKPFQLPPQIYKLCEEPV